MSFRLAQPGRQLREGLQVARGEPAALAEELHHHVVGARVQVPGDPGQGRLRPVRDDVGR